MIALWSSAPVVLGVSTRRLKSPWGASVAGAPDSWGCQTCTGEALGSTEQPASSAVVAHNASNVRAAENDLGAVMVDPSSMLGREFGGVVPTQQVTRRIGLQLGSDLMDVAQGRTQFAQRGSDLVDAAQAGLQRTLVFRKQLVQGLRGFLQRRHRGGRAIQSLASRAVDQLVGAGQRLVEFPGGGRALLDEVAQVFAFCRECGGGLVDVLEGVGDAVDVLL